MSNNVKTDGDDAFNGISTTRFGRSAESQAQIRDSGDVSASSPEDEPLNIYRLVPIAAADDPRWDNSPAEGEVVVAARTSGDARIVAAARELDFMEVDSAPAEDVTTVNASAYRNEKLYTVIEIERGQLGLQRGVLEGTVRVDNIRPTQ